MIRLALALSLSTAIAVGAEPPAIAAVQNRAGTAAAVAGDVIDLMGSGLAASPADATGWPLPSSLVSTQVFCNEYPAPLISVAPDRVRIQLPWELAGLASAQVRVVREGVAGEPTTLTLAGFAPAILAADATQVTPGQTVVFRVIGLGPRKLNPITGWGPRAEQAGAAFVRFAVVVGGIPAPVVRDGLATGSPADDAGVQAVSVQIPFNVPVGSAVPALVRIAGVESPAFPLSIQSPELRMALSPAAAQLPLGGSQKFSATVEGSDDGQVQWSVDSYGQSHGMSIWNGRLSATSMPSPNWVIVRATHASGAFATALAEVLAQDGRSYRIVPDSPVISAGESVAFTLVDSAGAAVDGVSWWISDGYSAVMENTYTAPLSYPPAQVRVAARMQGQYGYFWDVTATTITINPPRAQITGTSPAVGHIGEALTIQGSGVSARVAHVWFTGADGSGIRVGGTNGIATVPHGAVSGPIWLELNTGEGASFLSAPYPLTIRPRLRLHASRQRVSAGERIQIVAAAPNMPGSWALTWRADLGSVDSKGVFQAPTVTDRAFARIWVCLSGDTECASCVVEVAPLRLEPDPVILNPGETIQLAAWQGAGEISASWQAATANVTVTPDGKLTAGNGPFDGGRADVLATVGGVSQRLSVSVRTSGAIAHTAELLDWLGSDNNSATGRLGLGVYTSATAVRGNWIYAYSRSIPLYYGGVWLSSWLDVYQLDERKSPVWVDSMEAPHNGVSDLYIEGDVLNVVGSENAGGILLRFDISSGRPVLQSRQAIDPNGNAYRTRGMAFSLRSIPDLAGPVTLEVQDYASRSKRSLTLDYEPVGSGFSASAAGTARWAAVMFYYAFTSGVNYETVVFDITGEKAQPVAVLPSGCFACSLTAMDDVLVVGRDVYRVSDNEVTFVSELPCAFVLDADPETKRLLMGPIITMQEDGYRVVDLSDPANPRISASTVHSMQWTTGRLGPDYFVLLRGPQNVGVYPIEWRSGVRKLDHFPFTPWMNDVKARDGYLYWTGPGWGASGRSVSVGLFEVDDVSSYPATLLATIDRPGDQVGWAIELNGNYAYVGTDSELIVYDIRSPGAPVEARVLRAPAISMTLLGGYLYAGSADEQNRTLLVYDVSSPDNPRLVNGFVLSDWAYAVASQPGWVAVALGKKGLDVYSLQNPAAPVLRSHLEGTYWGVAGNGNLLYAAADYRGLVVYDLSGPDRNPASLSATSMGAGDEPYTSSYPFAMSVSLDPRGIAWICSAKDGRVYGLDVRTPTRPRHIGEITTAPGVQQYSCANTTVWNDTLFVAGNVAAHDVRVPQNVGLYEVAQPMPGEIRPDRFRDQQVVALGTPDTGEPLKARVLSGKTAHEDAAPAGRRVRTFRANRPEPGELRNPR